jgi:hypothetical protein|tara:strand:+ start:26508 stop:27341 length:834 start_codon:yes stop_codon:yes gene_type:complete
LPALNIEAIMLYYNYHPVTKEYLGSATARENPKVPANYLLPANATFVDPEIPSAGYVKVFDTETETWSEVEDNRGDTVYKKSDASTATVDWLGLIGDDYTNEIPASSFDEWSGNAWVTPDPTEGQIKAEARRRIEAVMPAWVVQRAQTGGPRIPANVLTYVKDVREASNTLEDTLPTDYTDDSHWPTAPASIVYEAAPVLTRKDDVWDRCTEAEAELLMTTLDQAPAKLRGMWMDNPYISHSHDQFPTLRSAIVTVLGGDTSAEERADELLAESEVL